MNEETRAREPVGDWGARAACSLVGPWLFECDLTEHAGRQPSAEYRRKNAQAKGICRTCPVVEECKAWAMSLPDPAFGLVAGGMTFRERQSARRQAVNARQADQEVDG